MNDQVIRFRLGVFVLSTLILLLVLIVLFGGQPGLFKQVKSYSIVLPNASGLAPGSPVKKSGVKIGEVTKVELDDETGKVNIGIETDKKFSLQKSDVPTLMQNLLGGDSFIAFLPPDDLKKLDPTVVPPGSVLVGVMPTDPGTVLQKTSDLIPGAQETLVEMKRVFQKIDRMAPIMETAVKDFAELARASRDFIPELRVTNSNLQALSKSANETMPSVKRTVEEIEVTARTWSRVGERVNVFMQSNDGKLNKTLENLELATRRAADLLDDENRKLVKEILKDVRTGSSRLESISRNADELLQEFRITGRNLNKTILAGEKTLQTAEKTLLTADKTFADIGKITAPLGERGPSVMKNIEDASVQLNRTLCDVRELIQAIGRSEGTFSKFMTDPSLYNNLNDAALSAVRIMPRVDRALRDFEIFADKIARHPESLGLGGVVRPGSGLKDPPSFWPPPR